MADGIYPYPANVENIASF